MKAKKLFMLVLTVLLSVTTVVRAQQDDLGWLHFGERDTHFYDKSSPTTPVTVNGNTYQAYPVIGMKGVYYVPNKSDSGTRNANLKILYLKNATLYKGIRCTKSTKNLWVVVSGNCNIIYGGGSGFKMEIGNLSIFGQSGASTDFLTITQTGNYKGMFATRGSINIENVTLNVSTKGSDAISQELKSGSLTVKNAIIKTNAPVLAKGGVDLTGCAFADNSFTWDSSNGYVLENGSTSKKVSITLNKGVRNSSSGTTASNSSSNSGWNERVMNDGRVIISKGDVSLTMIPVQRGTFTMGSKSLQKKKKKSTNVTEEVNGQDELPAHEVTISNSYYISETEVTQAVWRAVMNEDPTFPGLHLDENVAPKLNVTYNQAVLFTQRLSALTNEEFSLPTEAQWEFAARGGVKSKGYTYSGSENSLDVAWCSYNSKVGASSQPHAVKTKMPNELGIYDMSGNAYEWCKDAFKPYRSGAVKDPCVTGGTKYVRRGGSCYSDTYAARVTARQGCSPNTGCGVRIVMKLKVDLL